MVKLHPGINIFIGPNGSGKSNLLRFIYSLKDNLPLLDNDYSVEVSSVSQGKHLKKKIVKRFLPDSEIPMWKQLASESDNDIQYSFKLQVNKDVLIDLPFQSNLTVNRLNQKLANDITGNQDFAIDSFFYHISFVEFSSKEGFDYFLIKPEQVLLVKAEVFRIIRYEALLKSYIAQSISNIMDMEIDKIKKGYLDYFEKSINPFLKQVKLYSPIIGIRHKEYLDVRERNGVKIIENIQFEFLLADKEWYNWSDLSDGTKRIFQIIYYVYHAYDTVLIEEPELGIHPHQLRKLLDFLKEQAETKQIIISTHSPEVLDVLSSNQLDNINLVSNKKGKTVVKKLNKSQLEKANNYLTETGFLSDYWKYSDLEK